jgi:hypothetical protein
MVNFTLSGLNSTLSMDLSGTLAAEAPADLDVSATAVYYVKTSDMRNVFKFQTDSLDVNDISASDIKYYVFRESAWPAALKINPAHAAMSENAMLPSGVDASKNLVKHDFVRYLAQCLFNTIHGVDLFSNEDALLENIALKGRDARTAIELALDNVNTTKTGAGALTSAADASGNRYTTNALTDHTNICRELMRQVASQAASRFGATTDSTAVQSVPLVNDDTLNFKLTVAAAANQHDLTSRNDAIVPRVYKIKLILCADAGISSNVVPVDSASHADEYPYAPAV